MTRKFYTHNGITLSAKEWALKLGISRNAFYQRITDFTKADDIFKIGYARCPTRPNQFHGHSGSRSYNSWSDMLKRCTNPKNRKWRRYGGRGIKVCKRWMRFENFLADMGERPLGTTIDRKNNDGNYTKRNCRWATAKQQGRNTSTNVKITFNGVRTTVPEAAEKLGINPTTLRRRLKYQGRHYVTWADVKVRKSPKWIG